MCRLRLVTWLVLALLAGCSSHDQGLESELKSITWYDSVKEAQIQAQQAGDMILVSFEASWCPWSRLARESLYVNQAVMESLRSFRCVRLDAERDSVTCSTMGIKVYPTAVITDAYGVELGRMVGYHSPQEFLDRLTGIGEGNQRLAEMYRQEEALAGDPSFLLSFGGMLLEMGMYDGAMLRFERAMQLDSDDRLGTLEEASYSMAECYMLAGEYREAGRRFRLLTESHPHSERHEQAAILAALCYQRANYPGAAEEILADYLGNFDQGIYRDFAAAMLDSLRAGRQRGS